MQEVVWRCLGMLVCAVGFSISVSKKKTTEVQRGAYGVNIVRGQGRAIREPGGYHIHCSIARSTYV